MKDINKAKEMLSTGEYTCVLCHGESVTTSTMRGVRPLATLVHSGIEYNGYSAADRVVGRGAAFLYAKLGITQLYADVVSRSALQVLEEHRINTAYSTLVPNIINRAGDGICPFEAAVLDIDDVDEAYAAICDKMAELGIEL